MESSDFEEQVWTPPPITAAADEPLVDIRDPFPPLAVDETMPVMDDIQYEAAPSNERTAEEVAAEDAAAEERGYAIPDFDRDERELSLYEDAKRRTLRQMIASAETQINAAFAQRKEQLQAELEASHPLLEERRANARFTTRVYAEKCPLRVNKRGIEAPSFWENVLTFGSAGRAYRAASRASEGLEAFRLAIRKREEALGALESQQSRAIYLKEDSIKKHFQSDEGIEEFHHRSEIESLWKRVDAITQERERYAKRLEDGKISPEEQRDREIAQRHLRWVEVPLLAIIIARVARFGPLTYLVLRDLERKEYLLSYDPRLDPLRNSVFDIYIIAAETLVRLRRNDNGTAFRVADHFKVCWRNEEKAEEMYAAHRAALRDDRNLPANKPRNDVEADLIEKLAALAAAVDGAVARTVPDRFTSQPANTPTTRQ